jgi:formylglycine-generating enzyme required for sulfatase activity
MRLIFGLIFIILSFSCAKKSTEPDKGNNTTDTTPHGMKLIPGGSFQMGSNSGSADEKPIHSVFISSFYMDSNEVTQADYLELMNVNPSSYTGDLNRPIENVTWFDAVLYCNKRSKLKGLDTVYNYMNVGSCSSDVNCCGLDSITINYTKHGYRLPTEAEWEYACRAGAISDYYWGTDTSQANKYEWYANNSGLSTHPVSKKLPNAFGLYDMSGNVQEWCNDWFSPTYYSNSSSYNPQGPVSGDCRVFRGGSYDWSVEGLQLYIRRNDFPFERWSALGFRCVLPAQ